MRCIRTSYVCLVLNLCPLLWLLSAQSSFALSEQLLQLSTKYVFEHVLSVTTILIGLTTLLPCQTS